MRIKPANYAPRILLPDFSDSLSIYGPSIFSIKKIQILPPVGPIPKSKKLKPKFQQPLEVNQIEPFANSSINFKRELARSSEDEFEFLRTSKY